ncbi:helix-turn-helix domain-containing protein [Paracidovorax oryzae]|uniref:helix-turn-helix domain-containing protein n=1 Tax=Paracidovorax oryzae TaxID=862720 RepID=UPI0035D00F17
MSEPVAQDAQISSAEVERALADAAAAGAMLRQAREQAGMHVAALAVSLKVPVHKLEALEAGNLGVFPDAVFVRALVSSICRTLKIDAAPVLALLPQNQAPRLSSHEGINASFKPGSAKLASSSAAPGSRKVAFAVAFLLVAAVALVFVPREWFDRLQGAPSVATSEPSGAQETAQAGGAPSASPAGTVSEPVLLRQETLVGGAPLPPAPVASSAVAASSAPAAAPVVAAAASAPASAEAAQSALVIRARGDSWVQVRAATGGTVLQKLVRAGETVAVPGSPPWSVVVGKADATEVLVRGQPMDLAPVARENVARFEVK